MNVTSRDTGTYTAVYKLRENAPILETEIMMTVQYLPIPRVFGKEGKVNLVYMRRKETRTTATCLSALGEPPADMTWYKDGTKADEATHINGQWNQARSHNHTGSEHGTLENGKSRKIHSTKSET